MATIPNKSPRIGLDGKWFPCLPASEFGYLGERIMCELSPEAGRPPKKLLLRPVKRPREIELDKISEGEGIGVRPFALKTYQYLSFSAEGKPLTEERQFVQQDLTGLVTLRGAILNVVKEGSPRKVWHLFYSACKALNAYTKSFGGQRLVPLQCPNSLAVDAKTGQVIVLDAELRISTPTDSNEPAFVKWFGTAGRNRSAPANDASLLHSKALLLFFREVLGYLDKTGNAASIAEKLNTQLEVLSRSKSPQELEENAESFAEDWSLPAQEEAAIPMAVAAAVVSPGPRAGPAIRPEKARSWLAWFIYSLLINLLLAALVILLANAWLTQSTIDDPSLLYSSYCVVFPAPGTNDEKVLTALNELYPNKLFLEKGEPYQLLELQLDAAVKSLKEPEKLEKLLGSLNGEHSIRFTGYDEKAGESGLKSIIDKGGVYKIGTVGVAQHGSLLRSDSVEKILKVPGVEKHPGARVMLASLQQEIIKYASIRDAIMIRGTRSGFILRVDPSAKAHREMRAKLLTHVGTPVFVPRPAFELFGAVDPAVGEVTGIANYSLKLDRKCHWRWVGADDRKKTAFTKNSTNDKMKWKEVAANEKIEWSTLPVLRLNGRTDSLSSFDIAVVVKTKVILFRNQSILTGESRSDILKQSRGYLESLGFKNLVMDDVVSVSQQGKRFTGALLYNYLADQADQVKDSTEDLEIKTPAEFEGIRKREDGVLVQPK